MNLKNLMHTKILILTALKTKVFMHFFYGRVLIILTIGTMNETIIKFKKTGSFWLFFGSFWLLEPEFLAL